MSELRKVRGGKANPAQLNQLLKQKLGPAPMTWALHVDPERRTFGNLRRVES